MGVIIIIKKGILFGNVILKLTFILYNVARCLKSTVLKLVTQLLIHKT